MSSIDEWSRAHLASCDTACMPVPDLERATLSKYLRRNPTASGGFLSMASLRADSSSSLKPTDDRLRTCKAKQEIACKLYARRSQGKRVSSLSCRASFGAFGHALALDLCGALGHRNRNGRLSLFCEDRSCTRAPILGIVGFRTTAATSFWALACGLLHPRTTPRARRIQISKWARSIHIC